MSDTELFGLTAEQRFYIDAAAEKAAERAVEKAVTRLVSDECPHDCKDARHFRSTLYGDDGKSGLCGDFGTVKEQVSSLVWQTRVITVAVVTSIVGLVASFIASQG